MLMQKLEGIVEGKSLFVKSILFVNLINFVEPTGASESTFRPRPINSMDLWTFQRNVRWRRNAIQVQMVQTL